MPECLQHMDEGVSRAGESLADFPHQEVVLTRLLLLVGGTLLDELERNLKPYGLHDSDFRTLMMIYSSPTGSASPTELCEYAQQGATNMTRIANVLVKAGLVTRAADAEDRRRVVLSITATGRRLVKKLLPPLYPKVRGAFESLTASDKRTLDRLLRQIAVNIDSLTQSDLSP
ncbi:MAG TPA: MarR family transcriptional regulator [Dyella sp.]|uniref:MarR family winged helix-turn-helix transcriptional regulator n=1 Tax=Dyella sp. TaxID=1869338 RepID=UPI002D7A14B6|nr:MarR family transcriptional regulator [Dyella sp.]HET6552385.1 MarR family transcriptional regulator [Dyella sp.]